MELKKYKFIDLLQPDKGVMKGPFGGDIKKEFFVPKSADTYKVYEQSVVYNKNHRVGKYYISSERFSKLKRFEVKPKDILVSGAGTLGELYELPEDIEPGIINQALIRLRINENIVDRGFFKYYFSWYIKVVACRQIGASVIPNFPPIEDLKKITVLLPDLPTQHKIASVLSVLDSKIALNRAINRNLEALAKQLYDYWFVQFDFPDEKGQPYKSSGGKMMWNEEIQMSIPYGWDVCRLSDFIGKNNTGDWGTDEPTSNSIEIGCIRGADILSLNDLPKRYIKSNKVEKLLSEWDVVIEVSGGSPVQATGRSAYITPGVIERNGGNISCSNFCHAFSFKDYRDSAYFFYVWNMFYDNGIMFNYEGKTSGIKNFMTDVFLANKWINAPKTLIVKFYNVIKVIYAKIDANISENNSLVKQRDELLPLLMNGQIEVKQLNSDL